MTLDERFASAKQVGDAVLYEGYVLYPYRASAKKNQLRWQFGVLAPPGFESEPSSMQTETVIDGRDPAVSVRVRFLQVQSRTVVNASGRPLASLESGGQLWASFDEAVERQVDLIGTGTAVIALPGDTEEEHIPGGRLLRTRTPLSGRVQVDVEPWDGPYRLWRLRVTVSNLTSFAGGDRDEAMRNSLCSVHTLAAVDGGRFVSLMDPPHFAAAATASCTNIGTFPVLISDDVVLSSPVVLYDHPAVAPESQGDMFDATEIDEILALRVLTLTDEEKREARATDPRAAAIVDRCDAMDPASFAALHGTFRPVEWDAGTPTGEPSDDRPWWDAEVDASYDPWSDSTRIGDAVVQNGAKVRLHPSRRSDAQDLFVAGRTATVAGVFHSVEDEVYLAVVLDDDPGADLHQWHGRYLYFNPDEVEVVPS